MFEDRRGRAARLRLGRGVAGGRAPAAEGAGDRSTIGRFGRGLKSVFHLGEAFLSASSTADAENPGGHPDNVVSIWIGMGRHADWGNCADADSVLLRDFSAPLLAGEH